ncbi:hypothetical protein GCM10007874_01820 [Labrys miyagiensis]|uniref:Uncharacterized protein n=1 Tax=Labrys miyagiensis TaxID=346912 RepID=A0ABQ6CBZ0_9HYPH|nr:hypothetical protein [Labrys miyagiensis]GLS17167.1 hypothetical protein GCM10007874_01820 [Labrys miyagiensis]
MSNEKARFPIGTIVVLAAGSQAAKPPFRLGDDLTMESTTDGKSTCRITAITPETMEVTCATTHYSLTPAAATLEEGGVSAYVGGWVVRSIARS